MNIIGISGLAGSGKDTVANFMLENEGFVKVSLADPIKRIAMDLWNFTEEQLFGESKYRNAPDYRYPLNNNGEFLSPRLVLQHLGTEGGRYLDKDVWIRYAINISTQLLESKPKELYYSQINGLQKYIENSSQEEMKCNEYFPEKVKAVVIADIRFMNELKAIKKANGKVIRVIRPGSGLSGSFGSHQSESEMQSIPDSEFDYIIYNSSSLDDLKQFTNNIVQTL